MNTLNYIGCKHTLFNTLFSVCKENIVDMKNKTFMDLFAGTGVVGFNMLDNFKSCNANDLESYSYVINYALLKCNYTENIKNLIEICNKLDVIEGLIYNNFSPTSTCERMFFTNNNAKKSDAIRQYIQNQFELNKITEKEFYFLLASLLVSIDKVANTSCVYGAYLKEYKKSALKTMVVIPIHKKVDINESNEVFKITAEELSQKDIYFDVVYMDPPYNQRQYSANYCPLNYVAYYSENIVLKGKTGTIDGYNKSNFCSKPKVFNSFKTILDNIKCKYIFISYNNEGLLQHDEFVKLLGSYGELKLYKIQYKKFKAQKNVSGDTVYEYLWFINKTKKPSDLIEEIEY